MKNNGLKKKLETDFRLERCETRLLFSADILPLDYDPIIASNDTHHLQLKSESTAGTEQSNTLVTDSTYQLVFIDSRVADLDRILVEMGDANSQVIIRIIDQSEDALTAMNQTIMQQQNISSMHIISHASSGILDIGSSAVDLKSLLTRQQWISNWQEQLNTEADILIYGCDVASDEDGERFVAILSALTGADVAASTDLTGSSVHGGNWKFEHKTGQIETKNILTERLQRSFSETLATYTVSSLADSGAGSLREALALASGNAGQDRIVFSVSGTINLTSALPAISHQVEIDGTTAPGFSGTPVITINGSGTVNTPGIQLTTGSDGSTISGLRIINFSQEGIYVNTSDNNVIIGNQIGNNGTTAQGNLDGIEVFNSSGTVIGGTNASDTNIISGNSNAGVAIVGMGSTNNTVIGNAIGTNESGTASIANQTGIYISNGASNNTIGGSFGANSNIISGNSQDGLFLTGFGTNDNVIRGNVIGTDANGLMQLGNGRHGIYLFAGTQSTAIGGDINNTYNVISGNGFAGITINGDGDSDTRYNEIYGNYIGTDITGTATIANGSDGVYAFNEASDNIIGGTATSQRNVISGNTANGVHIADTTTHRHIIQNNYIGVAADGITALGNQQDGISVDGGGDDTIIGGVNLGNTISGNGFSGISLTGSSTRTIIQGNFIGTDSTGTVQIGNQHEGIYITNFANDTLIGGSLTGQGNTIAYNGSGGTYTEGIAIWHISSDHNTILGNVIYGNSGLSINLLGGSENAAGVTDNDLLDADIGANDLLNYPVLTLAALAGDSLDLTGSISAEALTDYRIQFFRIPAAETDVSNHGEGVEPIGHIDVTTDIAGHAVINATLNGVAALANDSITATATEIENAVQIGIDDNAAFGSTSEFSQNLAITLTLKAQDDSDDFAALILNHNPLSYWQLNETSGSIAGDSGSGGNNGNYVNPVVSQTGALGGSNDPAISLNGVADHITVANNANLQIANGTLQLWFNAQSSADYQTMFSKQSATASEGHTSLFLDPSGHLVGSIHDGSSYQTITSAAPVGWDTWHQATLTFGAEGLQLYLDGQLVGMNATSAGWVNNAEPFTLGASTMSSATGLTTPTEHFFSGALDEVLILDSQLSAADVMQWYATGVSDYRVTEGQSLVVSASDGVLKNDYTLSGSLSVNALLSGPSQANSFTLNPDGSFTYTHDGSESLSDSFTYEVTNGSSTDQATVFIEILPGNDAPVVTSANTFNVAENLTAVSTVTSTDVDGGTPVYSLIGATDDALFSINSSSGVLSFNTAPDFEAPADAGSDNVYNVTVQVDDQNGGLTTQNIAITVTNANDLPIITSANTFNVIENQTAVGTVTSTDVDGGTPVYSLIGATDDALFSINSSSGVLSFNTAPDFEAPADAGADNTYNVTVQVDDQNGGLSTQNIAITVTNANDLPIITSANTFNVIENQTAVGTITSTDVDGGTPIYSLIGATDDALFSINSSSGVLSFNTVPDFEAPADAGADNTYNVTVQVDDQNGGLTTQNIAITVTNINEAPSITSANTFNVIENQTAVGTVTSTDVDGGTPVYSLIGATDDALFSINSSSGVLSFNTAPDFEAPADAGADNTYNVTVQVDDQNGGLSTQNIAITVTNANDLPIITSANTFNVIENQTAVGTVTSTDVDGGTPVYSLIGATDDALFSINSSSGVLSFNTAPDFEAPADAGADNTYNVTVQVDDQNGGLSTQNIAITVTNANDLPIITSANTFNVIENQTAVGTVTSTDVDGGTPVYSLIGATDDALFSINSSSGVLSFNTAPDFEAPADAGNDNVYNVTVRVDDQNGGITTQNIAITVGDFNEFPVISGPFNFSAAENQTDIGIISANDEDGDALNFYLFSSPDRSLFNIDQQTGVLSFNAAPDFESALDFNNDNVYDLVVHVDDQNGGNALAAIQVSVTNINEAPIISSPNVISVAENQLNAAIVNATDAEGNILVYSLIGTIDDNRFTINPSTGTLAFNIAPDFESPNDSTADGTYHVTVQVSDQLGGLATQNLVITVIDENEAPVITSSGNFSVNENVAAVGTVSSLDVDGDSPIFSLVGTIDDNLLSIDSNTGFIRFNTVPNAESPADFGSDNIYEITVQVDDQRGGVATQQVSISVVNVNESPAVTSAGNYTTPENQAQIGIVSSADEDGDMAVYSLIGTTDDLLFDIDRTTGSLSFKAVPDFESPEDTNGDNVYNILVQIEDQNGGVTTQIITVTVVNDNEVPTITSPTSYLVGENQTSVGLVDAIDSDGDSLRYSLIGNIDDALFSIDGE